LEFAHLHIEPGANSTSIKASNTEVIISDPGEMCLIGRSSRKQMNEKNFKELTVNATLFPIGVTNSIAISKKFPTVEYSGTDQNTRADAVWILHDGSGYHQLWVF